MKTKHIWVYESTTQNPINTGSRADIEYKCSACGCRIRLEVYDPEIITIHNYTTGKRSEQSLYLEQDCP